MSNTRKSTRKPGRPRGHVLPVARLRTERIQVLVTPGEFQTMTQLACDAELPLSTWARAVLLGCREVG